MQRILIVDVETTGLDPKTDCVIEVAACLWSVTHNSAIATMAMLLPPTKANGAFPVNGISDAQLRDDAANSILIAMDEGPLWSAFKNAEAVLAHNAAFDRQFLGSWSLPQLPWICSKEDVVWPGVAIGQSLINTALAMGVAVVEAHRALADVELLRRMLQKCHDPAMLEAALQRSQLPKIRYVAKDSYEQNSIAKKAGFYWDPERREWFRRMRATDAALLMSKTDGLRLVESPD